MAQLALSNIINISVASAPAGIGLFNVNNLLLITNEAPGVSPTGGFTIYKNATDVAADYGSSSQTAQMAVAIFSQSPNILAGNGYLVIAPFTDPSSETLIAAIQRLQPKVQFFGIITNKDVGDTQLTAAANYVQTQNRMLFAYSADSAVTTPTTGEFWKFMNAGNTRSRGLLYMLDTFAHAGLMAAAYAGRALSTDFGGSNTTQTMQLKSLATILADTGMTQTIYQAAQAAGVDVYASFEGVAKVATSGLNHFFDQVYNLSWLIAALQTSGFNALAQTSNKVPQTEGGVNSLKTAYRRVCEQALTNGYAAPGSWTSPDTFGNQQDFLRNIAERGYYIYSAPVALQAQAARDARQAPLIQIAIKEAGAIHSSNVLVNINA